MPLYRLVYFTGRNIHDNSERSYFTFEVPASEENSDEKAKRIARSSFKELTGGKGAPDILLREIEKLSHTQFHEFR